MVLTQTVLYCTALHHTVHPYHNVLNQNLRVYSSCHCNVWQCRGQAGNGELGYGPSGKKSSANPDKVYALEGVHTHQVACGIGHTLFLVKPGSKQVSALCSCIVCSVWARLNSPCCALCPASGVQTPHVHGIHACNTDNHLPINQAYQAALWRSERAIGASHDSTMYLCFLMHVKMYIVTDRWIVKFHSANAYQMSVLPNFEV